MLIVLSLIAYLVLGIPFVAWLAHRLALANQDNATTAAGGTPDDRARLARPTPEAILG
jgi:hypothetical protein